jgi:hypothetical protein
MYSRATKLVTPLRLKHGLLLELGLKLKLGLLGLLGPELVLVLE